MLKYRHVQLRYFTLLEHICGIEQDRRVPQDSGAVEDEPGYRDPDEEGDIDGFAEPSACALVFNGIEQVNQFVLIHLAVAIGADTGWRWSYLTRGIMGNEGKRGIRRRLHRNRQLSLSLRVLLRCRLSGI